MRIIFTLLLTLFLLPAIGWTQDQTYHQGDIEALKKIAEANEEFTYRKNWLSDEPSIGITWSDSPQGKRVVEISFYEANFTTIDFSAFKELTTIDFKSKFRVLREVKLGELNKLTSIKITYGNISKIDLSSCKSLEEIQLKSNSLQDIKIDGLTKVKNLNCDLNELSKLDCTNCTSLEEIDCSNNQIREIKINDATQLTSLKCSYNKISNLDLSACKKLSEISCGNNEIEQLSVKELPDLELLQIESNDLTTIDLSNNPKLTSVNCNNNYLHELSIEALSKIESLYCSNNKLNTIHIGEHPHLQSLDCSGNHIFFKNLYQFKDLPKVLYSNQTFIDNSTFITENIIDFSMLIGSSTKVEWFDKSTNLKLPEDRFELNSENQFVSKLQGNYTAKLSDPNFPELTIHKKDIQVIGHKNETDILALQKIAKENRGFQHRNHWLDENPKWYGITWSESATDSRVIKMDLIYPHISKIDISTFNELEYINMLSSSSRELKEFIIGKHDHLTYISCSNQSITKLDLSQVNGLTYLDCSKNKISEIKINEDNISNLELDCSDNYLSFKMLTPLKHAQQLTYNKQKLTIDQFTVEQRVNLSQIINNEKTQIKWFDENGLKLNSDQYEIVSKGVYDFKYVGKYYATLTDSNFPELCFTTKLFTITGRQNSDDIAALRKIAQENPEFPYREYWLSDTPKWKGVTWNTVADNQQVYKLKLKDKNLEKLDVSTFQKLKYLDCSDNKIVELQINENIKELDCSYNCLNFKALSTLGKLEKLNYKFQHPSFDNILENRNVNLLKYINVKSSVIEWFNKSNSKLNDYKPEQIETGIFNLKYSGTYYAKISDPNFPELTLKTNVITIEEVKNTNDITILQKIARENPDFENRDDWLSEHPKWLGVYWNKIAEDSRVTYLYLSSRNLTVLDISSLDKLISLDCSRNKITELKAENTPELSKLDCSYNCLDFGSLSKLKKITSFDYQIQNPKFENIVNSNQIDLSKHIDPESTIVEWFDKNSDQLEETQYEVIEKGIFKLKYTGDFYAKLSDPSFPELEFSTKIISIPEVKNKDEIAALKKIAKENHNFIYRADWLSEKPEWKGVIWNKSFEDSRVLQLNLYDSKIENIDVSAFSELNTLKLYSYSESSLKKITFGTHQNIKHLNILRQKVEILDLSQLKNLISLNCHQTGISELDLSQNSSLEKLDCSNNPLTKLNTSNLKNLKSLDFESTKISEIDLSENTLLESLSCNYSRLRTLNLKNHSNLKYLNCRRNYLSSLFLPDHSQLEIVNCEENYLSLSQLNKILTYTIQKLSYQPQSNFTIYPDQNLIDLSSEAILNGVATQFTFYQEDIACNHLVQEIENGKFAFKKTGYYICKMQNKNVPNFTLTSSLFVIENTDEDFKLNENYQYVADFKGLARENAVGFAIENYGYLGFGSNEVLLNDFWKYDAYNNSWQELQTPAVPAREDAIGFAVNGKGYLGLGKNNDEQLTDIWEYNPKEDSWTKVSDYPGTNLQLFTWVLHQDKVYFFCGKKLNGDYSKEVWVYDPQSNKWEQKRDFPGDQRIGAVAYSLKGNIYFGNGFDYENGSFATNDLWKYEVENDNWSECENLFTSAMLDPIYFSIDGQGYYGLSGYSDSQLIKFDPKTESFEKASYPYSDENININNAVTFKIKDRLFLCGGSHIKGWNDKTIHAKVIAFTPPVQPIKNIEDLKIELITDNKIALTWKDMSDTEIAYEVLFSTDNQNFKCLKTLDINTEKYVSDDLLPETTYYFKIKTIGSQNDVLESKIVSITTLEEVIKEPTNLSLRLTSKVFVNLSWTDNSRAESIQKIMLSTDNIYWTEYDNVSANQTYYQSQKLEMGTTYYFKIIVMDEQGNEKESEVKSITTEKDYLIPASDLFAILSDHVNVNLQWVNNSTVDVQQEVLISTDNKEFTIHSKVSNETLELFIENLAPATTYFFKIKTSDSENRSVESETITITTDKYTLLPAENLLATLSDHVNVNLEWVNNSPVDIQQEILLSTDNSNFTVYSKVDSQTMNFLIKNLLPATTYYFKIRTIYSENESVESQAVSLTTDQVTGIDNIQKTDLKIYPNPASEYIKVKLSNDIYSTIYLINSKGRILQTKEGKTEVKFNVQENTNGLYFIRIKNKKGCKTEKFVIIRE